MTNGAPHRRADPLQTWLFSSVRAAPARSSGNRVGSARASEPCWSPCRSRRETPDGVDQAAAGGFSTPAAPPPRRRVAARRRARFFLKLMPCRSKNRQTELTPTRTPRSPSSPRISSRVRSARSPISANSQSVCGCSGERLRPFCDLAAPGAPPAAHPGGRRRLADAQPAPRPARRKTALNRPDDPDAQIARICPRHAVPQQHLWAYSRSIHYIWESCSRKISNLPSWKPL